MITVAEKCRIDSIEIGELQVNTISAPSSASGPMMTVKYALANASEGVRFGAGHMNSDWSERTMRLLGELLQSAEQDIAKSVFSGMPTTGGTDTVLEPLVHGVTSL